MPVRVVLVCLVSRLYACFEAVCMVQSTYL